MSSVVLVTNSLGHGGSEKQAAFIGAGLLARGWDVRVVSMLGRDDYANADLAGRVVVVGKRGRGDLPRVVSRVRELMPIDGPLLCFNWYPQVVAHLAAPDSLRIARFGGIPSADGVTSARRFLARRAQRSAEAVVGCSWGVARQAVAELGSPVSACSCIPNAVYFQADTTSGAAGAAWPRRYLLSVGRLSPEKDHETLLRAFALLAPRVEHDLLVAGDGEELDRLMRTAEELGVAERAHFLGYRHDVPALMQGADLLVHTSRWEGFGCALVEAMALGTPFVATDAPYGPRSIVDLVAGGVLVRVGDAEAVAGEVLRLLRDEGQRRRLAEIGVEGVPRFFSAERILDAYETLIEAASAARRGRAK